MQSLYEEMGGSEVRGTVFITSCLLVDNCMIMQLKLQPQILVAIQVRTHGKSDRMIMIACVHNYAYHC